MPSMMDPRSMNSCAPLSGWCARFYRPVPFPVFLRHRNRRHPPFRHILPADVSLVDTVRFPAFICRPASPDPLSFLMMRTHPRPANANRFPTQQGAAKRRHDIGPG